MKIFNAVWFFHKAFFVCTQIKRQRISYCYPGDNCLLIVNNKDTIIVPEKNFLVSLLAILNRYFPAGYYFKFSVVTMESKKNVICCNFFETNLLKNASQS